MPGIPARCYVLFYALGLAAVFTQTAAHRPLVAALVETRIGEGRADHGGGEEEQRAEDPRGHAREGAVLPGERVDDRARGVDGDALGREQLLEGA